MAVDDSKIHDGSIDQEEAELRGRAVEMFARLERSLDSVIATYYTPRHPLSTHFHLDVLMGEGFSFGLRREVFESITRRHGWYDDPGIQALRKAGRWRNFLAHVGGMKTVDTTDAENVKVGHRDPRHPHRILTVQEAFDDFKRACEKADQYVMDVLAKVNPMGPFAIAGHIVEEPVPPGGHLEDSYKPDWNPFASPPNAKR